MTEPVLLALAVGCLVFLLAVGRHVSDVWAEFRAREYHRSCILLYEKIAADWREVLNRLSQEFRETFDDAFTQGMRGIKIKIEIQVEGLEETLEEFERVSSMVTGAT